MSTRLNIPSPRIFLCGITSNKEKELDRLTKDIWQYFDGLIWVVHNDSTDESFNILDSRKKAGKIIRRDFIKRHDISMSEFLCCGIMKNFDWYVSIDSQEQLSIEWCKNLKEQIKIYQQNGIGVGMIGRPYLVQYFNGQTYQGNAHCWPSPLKGQFVNLDESILIKKPMDANHGLISSFKYFWTYGFTNQIFAQYRKYSDDIVKHHDDLWFNFQLYWEQNMNREFTLESVESYFKEIYNDKSKIDPTFLEYMEFEFFFADFFRLKILNHKWPDDFTDRNRRFSWSFKEWINTGDTEQLVPKRKGIMIQYNEQFGIKDE